MWKKIKNINHKNDAVAILILDKTDFRKIIFSRKNRTMIEMSNHKDTVIIKEHVYNNSTKCKKQKWIEKADKFEIIVKYFNILISKIYRINK